MLNKYFKKFGIRSTAGSRLLSVGITSEIKANRPVLLFGFIKPPKGVGKKEGHAVVGYGISKDNRNIVHYGWPGRPRVVLVCDIIGSSTYVYRKG